MCLNPPQKGEVFGGLEMCVMGVGVETSKQVLEMLVVEHRGTITSTQVRRLVANNVFLLYIY